MTHRQHKEHDHQHGPGCGHRAVTHNKHVDYLHDGHLHHEGKKGIEEHTISISEKNPTGCRGKVAHEDGHVHGEGCGHETVPHGDHVDFLVDGALHHPHGKHCDHHGPLLTQ